LGRTLPQALLIKSRSARFTAISVILRKGVAGPNLHHSLQTLIAEEGPKDVKLIELLLRSNASINYTGADGQNCIVMVAERGDSAMIELLCRSSGTNQTPVSADVLSKSFNSCINLRREARLATAKKLLSLGLPVQMIDEHLRKVVTENDLDLLRLMLQSRNQTLPEDSELFIIAIRADNIEAITLLLQATPSRSTIATAFTTAIMQNLLVSNEMGLKIGEILLQTHSVGAEAINDSLVQVVQTYRSPVREQFASLLLQHKADVNWKNASATMAVAGHSDLAFFKTLLRAGARLNVVIPALINLAGDSKWTEQDLLERLELCIRPVDNVLDERDSSTLFLAMSRFPMGAKLVEFFLKHGWSANYLASCKIEANQPEELVPALLWAICQSHNAIRTSVIRELLKNGGK
jgi:ankyrin repeat protein